MAARRTSLFACAALAVVAAALPSAPARAYSPFLVVPDPADAEATPAYRYANMTDAEAMAELDARHLLYTKLASVPGVRAPIRLTGRLHGVHFHSSLPPDARAASPFEILDARLALALDDFAALLEKHDIDEVVHFTMYRPNVAGPEHAVSDEPTSSGLAARTAARVGKGAASPARARGATSTQARTSALGAAPPASALGKGAHEAHAKGNGASAAVKQKWGDGVKTVEPAIAAPAPLPLPRAVSTRSLAPKPAAPASARVVAPSPHASASRSTPAASAPRSTPAPPGTRHPAGLAIDVGMLHKKDGRWLSVASHFHGHIGDKTCGDGARVPEEPDARELRALVCEAQAAGVFTYVLTPDYNAAHADHFHMEIKPGVHWFLYH